jgi:CHC2 zinc finger
LAGADRVARLIPRARIVRLPAEVGEHGDVTDFFVRLDRTREDFLRLLGKAQPMPAREETHGAGTVKVSRWSAVSGDTSDITSQIKIEELIGRYLSLRPSGKNLIARCPFHEDHHPSFVVYPATQSFYCFGCRAHGDAAGFLMRMERLPFPEALKVICELAQ